LSVIANIPSSIELHVRPPQKIGAS
jgi:hypothetical protein